MNTIKEVNEIVRRQGQNPAYITSKNAQHFAPFALFDAGRVPSHNPLVIDWHPHSGVATITFPYDAKLHHQDSAGNVGTIENQGLQWMASGTGIWHKESYQATNQNRIGIIQLWLMLDPQEEIEPAKYFDLHPNDIPFVQDQNKNTTRVLLGEYHGLKAAKPIHHNASYLDVHLKAGDSWQFNPNKNQVRGFVYSRVGSLSIGEARVHEQELALLNEDNKPLQVTALTDTQFVVAMTEPWVHPVVSHYGQIHTSEAALEQASQQIHFLRNKWKKSS